MKHGFAEILLVVLIAAAGIFGPRLLRRDRPSVERQYRGTVESTMDAVAGALGLEWKTRRISVGVLPGERQDSRGYWERWIQSENDWKAGFAQPGRATVIVHPGTRSLAGGVWSVLGHELAHVLLWQHSVAGDQHHETMRKAGVLWARL